MLKEEGINSLYDFHAHISSGGSDFVGSALKEDIAELPPSPFSLQDINSFYNSLFRAEGIKVKVVVFDTPLPAYDLRKKNNDLLDKVASMNPEESSQVIPFAIITPKMKREEIEGYVERGAKGFKISPRTTPPYRFRRKVSDVTLEDMLTHEVMEVADAYKLPLLIHLPQSVASARISDNIKRRLKEILTAYPHLKLVLAHLGLSQTPSKIEDTLKWIEEDKLRERIYLDISAVTIPSVLEIAFSSKARLLFGTDMDFSLSEWGKYIMLKEIDGRKILANEEERGDLMAVLVSASFGDKYKELISQQGIEIKPAHFPLPA